MKHREIDFAVREEKPFGWRWIIYPGKEVCPKVEGELFFASEDEATAACKKEIDCGLDTPKRNEISHPD